LDVLHQQLLRPFAQGRALQHKNGALQRLQKMRGRLSNRISGIGLILPQVAGCRL